MIETLLFGELDEDNEVGLCYTRADGTTSNYEDYLHAKDIPATIEFLEKQYALYQARQHNKYLEEIRSEDYGSR